MYILRPTCSLSLCGVLFHLRQPLSQHLGGDCHVWDSGGVPREFPFGLGLVVSHAIRLWAHLHRSARSLMVGHLAVRRKRSGGFGALAHLVGGGRSGTRPFRSTLVGWLKQSATSCLLPPCQVKDGDFARFSDGLHQGGSASADLASSMLAFASSRDARPKALIFHRWRPHKTSPPPPHILPRAIPQACAAFVRRSHA